MLLPGIKKPLSYTPRRHRNICPDGLFGQLPKIAFAPVARRVNKTASGDDNPTLLAAGGRCLTSQERNVAVLLIVVAAASAFVLWNFSDRA